MNRARLPLAMLTIATAVTAFLGAGAVSTAGAADAMTRATGPAGPAYSVTTMHFLVHVGPGRATTCDVLGDLFVPRGASATHRVPALLSTNGFGGSKTDQEPLARLFARRGYAVLDYSGLGFGGSGCKITLDDPTWDGQAASQLVSYLGGAPGIAFADAAHTHPEPVLTSIVRDHRAHDGTWMAHDPRVGMYGLSYGGGIQFSAAAVDPRIDAITPLDTWNDLRYSLNPNDLRTGAGLMSADAPGAIKLNWGAGLAAEGLESGVTGAQQDPSRVVGCPDFATFVCPALATGATTGYFAPAASASFRHASVASFTPRIRIPTLLIQGEADTLFNLNEASTTYRALRAQHTPVKMVWEYFGHSDPTPKPGEYGLTDPNPHTQYVVGRISRWFDHYLKDARVGTGPRFAYFRDWVHYTGIATPAYATSPTFPVGRQRVFHLDGRTLSQRRTGLKAVTETFTTPPAGAPTVVDSPDVLNSFTGVLDDPSHDLPGTTATWSTGAPTTPLEVVGSPTVTLQLDAPVAAAAQAAGPAGRLVLFLKIRDVAPGKAPVVVRNLVAPVRLVDIGHRFTVRMPAFVHRFAAGHRLQLVVAGASTNYRGGLTPQPVSITSGSPLQQVALPVVG